MQRAPGERREHERRDPEPNGEEREQRVDRHGLLHRHERIAPDRRDADQCDHRRQAQPRHLRRLLADQRRGVWRRQRGTLIWMSPIDTPPEPTPDPTLDNLGRPVRDLRISVTDRCNFRCVYCMPKEIFGRGYRFVDRKELLSFEEIERIAGAFVEHGVEKIRITGGEPLLRRDLEVLIARLAARDGLDIALTTNGALLPQKAEALAAAGLKRVTVSLDSLDDATFRGMNDVGFPTSRVLEGIDAAAAAGLGVKVNAVVKRGVNDDQVVALARHFHGSGHILRFIEYMDVGATNGWRLDDVLPAAEIVSLIDAELPLEPAEENYRGEVARR